MKQARDDCVWVTTFCIASCILCIAIAWGSAQTERNIIRSAVVVEPVAPQPSITLPCEVVAVTDGDTVTVEGTWRTKVRLLNVWAPERSAPGGKKATDHISKLVHSRKATLSIPFDRARSIGDVMTFDRVLGEIWMDGECESVNTYMVRDGFATLEKRR
jgi:endonuclease YncB( thermonuclease family)